MVLHVTSVRQLAKSAMLPVEITHMHSFSTNQIIWHISLSRIRALSQRMFIIYMRDMKSLTHPANVTCTLYYF